MTLQNAIHCSGRLKKRESPSIIVLIRRQGEGSVNMTASTRFLVVLLFIALSGAAPSGDIVENFSDNYEAQEVKDSIKKIYMDSD